MNLSGWLGQQACHLGVTGGRTRVRQVGREAASARVGVAICGAGQRRPQISVGELRLAVGVSKRKIIWMLQVRRPERRTRAYAGQGTGYACR